MRPANSLDRQSLQRCAAAALTMAVGNTLREQCRTLDVAPVVVAGVIAVGVLAGFVVLGWTTATEAPGGVRVALAGTAGGFCAYNGTAVTVAGLPSPAALLATVLLLGAAPVGMVVGAALGRRRLPRR